MAKKYAYIVIILAVASTLIAASFLNISDKSDSEVEIEAEGKIKGLSFVAPPRPFEADPMINIVKVNAEWISIMPFGFIRGDDTEVIFNTQRQWWGEREDGILESIKKAKEHNIKVMLKPHIWMHDGWVGDFEAETEEGWKKWEDSYTKYIMLYARIAKENDVEMLCIGTELKKAMKVRKDYWVGLIEQLRAVYSGPLTYSSNWDEYMDVKIWDKLDFIGISAYFPLTDSPVPSHKELKKKWQPTVKALQAFSKKHDKKILFTEFGYLSLNGCAGKTWILEKEREKHAANPEAQSIAIHCLFDAFWEKDWWAGGFIWKWYPEISERRKNFQFKDYSPQGKVAEQTLSDWYKKT